MSEVAYRSLFCMLSTSRDEAAMHSFKLVPLVRTPGHSGDRPRRIGHASHPAPG